MSFTLPFPNLTPPGTPAQVEQVVANFNAITTQFNSAVFAGFQTVFQATDPAYGMSVNNTGPQNVAALQLAVNAALANNGLGGIVYIPAGEYTMTGTVNVQGNAVKNGIIFQGSGVGTLLLQTNLQANIFDVGPLSQGNTGGCVFKNLFFRFQASSPQSGATGAAIFIAGAQNTIAQQCIFLNCPYGMSDGGLSSTGSLQCGIDNCQFSNLYMQGGSQVNLSGNVQFVRNSVFLGNGSGTPLNSVAITVTGSQLFWISGNQISGFPQGIVLTASTTAGTNTLNQVMVTDNFVASDGVAITIVPSNAANSKIYDIKISQCTIQHGQGSSTQASGIYIDSNGQANTNVQGIQINDCMIEGWTNSGLLIGCCSGVVVNGGFFGSNGLSPSATVQGSNIAISNGAGGVADNIRVVGAFLGGTFAFNGGITPYAVALYGGCTDVWILNCDFSGTTNTGPSAVITSAQGSHCFIKECRGYNNVNAVIATSQPGSGIWFDALGYGVGSPSAWTVPFFGDYLVTMTATGMGNVYLSHDRSELTKSLWGVPSTAFNIRMNAQQSLQVAYSGPASACIFNIFGV